MGTPTLSGNAHRDGGLSFGSGMGGSTQEIREGDVV
jgi:hypothetical protein